MPERLAGSWLDDDCTEPNYDNDGMRTAQMPAVDQETLCTICTITSAERYAGQVFETIVYGG